MLVRPSIYLQKINWVYLTSVCRLKSVSHGEMSTRFRKTCISLPCPLCTLIVSSRPEAPGTVIFLNFVIVLLFLFRILCFLLYAYSSFLPLPSSNSIHLVSSLPAVSTPPPRSTSLPISSLLPYTPYSYLLLISSFFHPLIHFFIPFSLSTLFSSFFYTISSFSFISYSIYYSSSHLLLPPIFFVWFISRCW